MAVRCCKHGSAVLGLVLLQHRLEGLPRDHKPWNKGNRSETPYELQRRARLFNKVLESIGMADPAPEESIEAIQRVLQTDQAKARH